MIYTRHIAPVKFLGNIILYQRIFEMNGRPQPDIYLRWSNMTAFYQYVGLWIYTKEMSKEYAEMVYMAIEAVDPVLVFTADFTGCQVDEEYAPAMEEFLTSFLKRK